MKKTAFYQHDKTLEHETGPGHPERPSRIRAIVEALDKAGLDPPRPAIPEASREDLTRVHDGEYVGLIERICKEGMGYPDPDTTMGPGSWEPALLSAGAAIAACRAVLNGDYDNAFSAMRPPGHHAESDRAMGFCLFNNIAIAARWLRTEGGVERVAIFDWDVHHGNGTQHTFYEDDTVFYASIHEHPLFPGTGYPDETGKNNTNLNVQMRGGSGPEAWIEALDRQVLPALEQFDPGFLLISAGFDAHSYDPLATQMLKSETFADMTRRVQHLAGGRIVSILEGGYNLEALGESAAAHFRALQEGADETD